MIKKNLVKLDYILNRVFLKKGKLSKISSLTDKIHLSITKSTKKNSSEILNEAIDNIMPIFLISNRKMGKRVVTIPSFIVSYHTRRCLGFKWIVESALKRKGVFTDNMVLEILEAYENKGSVKKKQRDLNLDVLANKSNLRYRW
jgi:small subunit ribosomal protein S7